MEKYMKKDLIGLGSSGNRVYKVISKEDKDKLYIITEFAQGGDLKTYIKDKTKKLEFVEESKIWGWIYQLSLAIRFLHSNKIIHRDIKAENVFLTKGMDIKLGDFGVSKALNSGCDYAETGIGTPFFLSPEICKGEKYNFKTDIWMLGCLIYELCFLKRPFEGESISMIMIQIINTFPAFNTEIHSYSYSSTLLGLISQCLSKNPDERPNSDEIFLLAQSQIENSKCTNEDQVGKNDNGAFKHRNFNNSYRKREKNLSFDSSATNNNTNNISKNEKLKLQIEVDEEENEVNDFLNKMIFVDNQIGGKNNFNNKLIDSNEIEAFKNNQENSQNDLKNGFKSISFNSKIFLQKHDEMNNSDFYSQQEEFAYAKFKNSTPSYCKEDIKKILKNMKISPVNNPGTSSNTNLISSTNNENNSKFVKNFSSDNTIKNNLQKDSKPKLDLFRKSSITTTNSFSTSNSLQSDQTFNLNHNRNFNFTKNNPKSSANGNSYELKKELSLNLNNKNLNNNSGKIFINNTTKNNAVSLNKINFNLCTKDIETSKTSYANGTRNQNTPTPDSTKMQYFGNFNKSSNMSNAKNNLNKLNELKKGHLKTISINISSMQSPEHKAVYEIENIEQCQNIGFPKLDGNFKNRFTFTPTNAPLLQKNRIIEALSPRKIRDLSKSTKVGTAVQNKNKDLDNKDDSLCNFEYVENQNISNFNNKSDNRGINKSWNEKEICTNRNNKETLIVRFLIEKYGMERFLMLRSTVRRNESYNNNDPKSKEYLIDEDKIRTIVGEEEYKITINYMKYFNPKKSDF